MAHHYGNLLQKHPSYSHRGTLRQKKRQRERDSEKGKGRGKREKQIEVVQQRGVSGGGEKKAGRQIIRGSQHQSLRTAKRKERKGDLRK